MRITMGRSARLDRRMSLLTNVRRRARLLERLDSQALVLAVIAVVLLAHNLHHCKAQLQSASKQTQSIVADEKILHAELGRLREVQSIATACGPALLDVRQGISDILGTHYVSVQISHVARLHEKLMTAMVACGAYPLPDSDLSDPDL